MAASAMSAALLGAPAGSSNTDAPGVRGMLTPALQSALSWYLQRPSVKLRQKEVWLFASR